MATPTLFDPIIARASLRFDVPFAFIKAVIRQESVFDPEAISPRGALGLMQLMPDTANEYGCTVNAEVDERLDPERNVMAGTKYLAKLLKDYGGDKRLTLAGYNAGPGHVREYSGVPPFPETQHYIAKVLEYEAEELAEASAEEAEV